MVLKIVDLLNSDSHIFSPKIISNMEKFKVLSTKGAKAFKNEQYLQAISFYSDALSLSPDDEDVLGCRSAVYAKLGMFNESKKDAESLISIIPQKPKGHFLRAVSLENLGNYRECLKSYLKTYELDTAHPTELLLRIIEAVGCICQMSETEELTLSDDQGLSFHKFERFVQLGERLYETGNYKICIGVIATALKAHYGWNEQLLYSQASLTNLFGKTDIKETDQNPAFSCDHVADELEPALPINPVSGFSSIYLATGHHESGDERESAEQHGGVSLQNSRAVMLALLIMGEAHYSLYHYNEALSVARKCLTIALDFKDKEYEIKCYVKLANIYHRLAQYVQAVSYNGKLLAVGRDLQNSSEDKEKYQEYWNSDVERRAVWNLSAAYKLMGDYKRALEHAQEYMEVLRFIDQENLTTAYANLGDLELLQGNYDKALECYKIELQLSKKFDDRHGVAYAYGNIGTVYAHMGSFKLADVNHEQHLKLAQSLNDKVSELMAFRNFGCLYKLMGDQTKALSYFERHLQLAKVNKMKELEYKAFSLVGACYRELHQFHHAQYYYEMCLKLAVEHSDLEEELECRLALAQITKSMRNFETSRQYFNKAIPVLEDKLLSKYGKSFIYKDPLLEKLDGCYKDLQEALVEMNLEEEALEIAEHCRSRILVNILRHKNVLATAESLSLPSSEPHVTPYSAKDIVDIVNSQQATILFFSTIPSGFLLWMLAPGKGIVKCHWHKSCDHSSFANKIKLCIEELHSTCTESYNCDHRALPDADAGKHSESSDKMKSKRVCYSCEFFYSAKLTPLQKLYDLLLSPVEDELKIDLGNGANELVIIPDLEVNSVPFPCLQDQEGKYLHEDFNVRILPCIRAISQKSKVTEHSSSAKNQVQDSPKILVQGNPEITSVDLNGKIWSPKNQSDLAEEEVNTIASLLGVDPISGHQATKEHFLNTLPETSMVHLVTYGSWPDACIALSPATHHQGNPLSEESFMVRVSDIALLKLSTKLVVLNACCGCGRKYCQLKHASFHLATAFLAAGVQSVVMPLWSAPQASLLNLFYKFYSGLEMGKTVSESLKEAWTQVRSEEHMSSPNSWAPFVHVGFDTPVNLMKLRHQLFDGVLDQVVKSSSPERFPLVTAETLDNKVPSVAVKIKAFQELLTQLLQQHSALPHVLPALKDVVQMAHQMLLSYHDPELVLSEDFTMCAQLSSHVLESPYAKEFLAFLGFDFQKDGAHDKDPFVVFPHWDPDGTMAMTSQVLQAVCDILKVSSSGGYALAKITNTLRKNTMEKLKEFLSLSCRYPERIMKTSDFVLRSLWYSPELQRFLASLGFYEVGQSLLFNKTEGNQILLKSTLLIVSKMLDYIEKGKTRTPSSFRESRSSDGRPAKLASLSPQLTPSKQIVMETPWMSTKADSSENDLKITLARQLERINKEFAGHVTRSNYWHAQLLRAQSAPGSKLPVIGGKTQNKPSEKTRTAQKTGKVKVVAGMTPSCNRQSVEEEPRLSINDTRERRNEIYRIYAQRFDDIAMHKRHKVRQLFLSQIGDHG